MRHALVLGMILQSSTMSCALRRMLSAPCQWGTEATPATKECSPLAVRGPVCEILTYSLLQNYIASTVTTIMRVASQYTGMVDIVGRHCSVAV